MSYVVAMLKSCLKKLCAIGDWFRCWFTPGRHAPEPGNKNSDISRPGFPEELPTLFPEEPPTTVKATANVIEWFPNAPRRSIVLAQRFVDAALALPGVTAEKHGDGIEFRPNFVWIERVYTLHQGFKLSLKGSLFEIKAHLPHATSGYLNFTRARIDSEERLDGAIKCIPIAWRAR
jgi:hypothetical protein